MTKRRLFLAEMKSIGPWPRLLSMIEPYYPKAKQGRPPIGLERMLRIGFLREWYALSGDAGQHRNARLLASGAMNMRPFWLHVIG